ncbi:PorV/PorQ family protein [Calditrichota bacterium LG25]
MKRWLFVWLISLVFCSSSVSFAQGSIAVPFVTIHPAPHLNGMAGAFTALPTADPFGQFFNPAQLAIFARQNNFSVQFYPQKTRWLPQLTFHDFTFSSAAAAFGYSSDKILRNLPLSFAAGFVNSRLDLGKLVWTDEAGNQLGTFHSDETYQQFSFGMGLDWYIKFNMGFALKNINTNLYPANVGTEGQKKDRSARTIDYGFLLIIPATDLLNVKGFSCSSLGQVQPFFDLTFGFSVLNVGDEMYYIDKDQADPFPRTAAIGYGLSMGLDGLVWDTRLRLIKADWSSEARNLLVDCNTDETWDYVAFPGKINLKDHVLLGKYDQSTAIYQGYRFQALEFIEYSFGYFRGGGYHPYIKTQGIQISSTGLGKIFSARIDHLILKELLNRLSVSYVWSKYSSTETSHPLSGTEFQGFTLTLRGLF